MALDMTKMKCINHGTQRNWFYESGADDVSAGGYFNAMAKNLQVNDVIASVPDAGSMRHYSVTSISAGVVTVVGSQIT